MIATRRYERDSPHSTVSQIAKNVTVTRTPPHRLHRAPFLPDISNIHKLHSPTKSDKFLEGLVYPHFPLPTHSPKRLPQRRRLDPEQARTSPGKPSVVLSMALVAVIAPLDSTRYRVHWRVCATLDYSQTELEYFAAQGRARGQGGGEVIG